jgi:parallel beta-helix repeat protein
VAAFPGERPRIQAGGWQVVNIKDSSYIDIRGLELVGTSDSNSQPTSGVEVRNSHHVRVIGTIAHHLGGGGLTTIEANHVTFEGNEIYETSKWSQYQTSGISMFQSRNVGGGNNSDGFSMYIRNNVIHDIRTPDNLQATDGNCVIIDMNREFGFSGATSITNNVCRDSSGRGLHVFHSDNVTVANNTVSGNLRDSDLAGEGELSALQATNVVFRNNLVSPYRAGRGNHTWNASNITWEHNVYVGGQPEVSSPTDRIAASVAAALALSPRPGA